MRPFLISTLITVLVSAQTIFDRLFAPAPVQCFNASYSQIDDSTLSFWREKFSKDNITEPFSMLLYLIEYFSAFKPADGSDYLTIEQIFKKKESNKKSSIIAICAIMQHLGWDVQYFYNGEEDYFGLNISDNWKIRKAHWIEKDHKKYYLKEFDNKTPVGQLKTRQSARTYQGLKNIRAILNPLPLIKQLPKFEGEYISRSLAWQYNDTEYRLTVQVPKEQVEWTKNLPPSLYGMVYAGIEELENTGLIEKLKFLCAEFGEYDRVNFLLKFCQSENVFLYQSGLPIKSVTQQLIEGQNDCDGRSVFLYVLLRSVAEYPESSIVFLSWKNHIALGLKPKDSATLEILKKDGFSVGDKYYILDPSYCGDTHWGSKMERLSTKCTMIRNRTQ